MSNRSLVHTLARASGMSASPKPTSLSHRPAIASGSHKAPRTTAAETMTTPMVQPFCTKASGETHQISEAPTPHAPRLPTSHRAISTPRVAGRDPPERGRSTPPPPGADDEPQSNLTSPRRGEGRVGTGISSRTPEPQDGDDDHHLYDACDNRNPIRDAVGGSYDESQDREQQREPTKDAS